MDNKKIILQLEEVVELLNQNKELQEEIDYKAMHSTMPAVEKLSKQTGSIKGIPNAIKSIPMPPVEDTVTEKTAILEKSKAKFKICSIVVIALFVIYIIAGEGFQSIISIPLIISGIVWLLAASKYNMSKNDLKNNRISLMDEENLREEAYRTWKEALNTYETDKKAGMEEAEKYLNKYIKFYENFMGILDDLEKKKEEYSKKQEDNRKKLLAYEFIPEEYWEYAPSILKALKSGRADNYKEALNLVITEEREKAERIAQKEMLEMQARLLEEQAEEERRHNRQMELAQAEANRMQEAHYREMEYAQKEQAKQQERAEREAKLKEAEEHHKALLRCQKCANRMACSTRGIANCGAFVADSAYKN